MHYLAHALRGQWERRGAPTLRRMSTGTAGHPHPGPSPHRHGLQRACRSLAWATLVAASICAALELLAGPGYRLGWWSLGTGHPDDALGGDAALAAAGVALAATLCAGALRHASQRAARRGGDRARSRCGRAAALSRLEGGPAAAHPRHQHRHREPAALRRRAAAARGRAELDRVRRHGRGRAARRLSGHRTAAARRAAGAGVRARARVARSMGWDIVAVAPPEMRIEATATTLLFGFKDDVVIRVAAQGAGSRIDMRSLSRVGGSDFGVNARARARLPAPARRRARRRSMSAFCSGSCSSECPSPSGPPRRPGPSRTDPRWRGTSRRSPGR